MSEIREEAQRFWEESAPHWANAAERFSRMAQPVTDWLLEAAEAGPGSRVLELGAGPSPVSLVLAERGAEVLVTDAIEEMLASARERHAGRAGVEWAIEDAEAISRPTAAFDAVLSRWGLMFTVDPEAPFREIRRVLKPGGRLVMAAWAPPEQNPWFTVPGRVLLEQGLTEPTPPGDANRKGPGASPGRLAGLIEGAGFDDVDVRDLPFRAAFGSFEDLWALLSELGNAVRNGLALTNDSGREALRAGVEEGFAPYRHDDGTYGIPVTALMARASA